MGWGGVGWLVEGYGVDGGRCREGGWEGGRMGGREGVVCWLKSRTHLSTGCFCE